ESRCVWQHSAGSSTRKFCLSTRFQSSQMHCYHSCQNLNHALDSGVRSAGPLVALYVSSGPTHPCALWLARRFKDKAALVCECRSSDGNLGGGCLFEDAAHARCHEFRVRCCVRIAKDSLDRAGGRLSL